MLTPEECFERVEMRFRAMLRKRHVPLGILATLEEDLTGFFRCVGDGTLRDFFFFRKCNLCLHSSIGTFFPFQRVPSIRLGIEIKLQLRTTFAACPMPVLGPEIVVL